MKGRKLSHESGCPHNSTPRTAQQCTNKSVTGKGGGVVVMGRGGGRPGPWRTHHHSYDELELVDAIATLTRFFVKRHDLLALGRIGDHLGLLELPFA